MKAAMMAVKRADLLAVRKAAWTGLRSVFPWAWKSAGLLAHKSVEWAE